MKKLISILLLSAFVFITVLMITGCEKEPVQTSDQSEVLKTVYHYSATGNSRACAPATNLNAFVLYGYLNFQWTVNGGQHILFSIDGITNTQYFAGAGWTGISIPLTEMQSYCGGTVNWHITTYCEPWYVGTDSSLISKEYASAAMNLSCPPQMNNTGHGHGNHGHGH